MALPSLLPFKPLSSTLSLTLSQFYTFSLSFFLSFFLFLNLQSIMKLVKITSKNFSPKRLFGSKKDRSKVSRSEPPSFGSGSSSSSGSSSVHHKPLHKSSPPPESTTPTSVLPHLSGDWSEFSDINLELVQAFKTIDRDNDGIVSRKELSALLSRLFASEPPTEEEVSIMLGELDRNGDGFVTLEALMGRVGSVSGPACDSELRETFEIFDADHDGKITAEELFRVFSTIGDEGCTLEDCRRMIAGVDRNGDGFVCFEDFARMMEQQR